MKRGDEQHGQEPAAEQAGELSLEHEVEIAVPPDQAFEWLVDRGRMRRWCAALGVPESFADHLPERAELRAGYRAELGTEARADMRSRETSEVSTEWAITAYQPPSTYATELRHPDHETSDSYSLEPVAGGTRLRHRRRSRYLGRAAQGIALAARFGHDGLGAFEKYAHDDFRRSLDCLKELIEADAPGGPPGRSG